MAIDQQQEAVFENPSQGYQEVDAGKYVLKINKLRPCDPGQFGPMIEWVFNLAFEGSTTPIYSQDGKPAEMRQRTGTSLTPKAKARKWAEAFLDRDLGDDDSGPGIARELVGKKAIGIIGPNDKGYSTILQIMPMRATKAAAGKSAAVQALEGDLPQANDGGDF